MSLQGESNAENHLTIWILYTSR
uniref:Uncharacterized protein n=1 Tax=Phlebotomus papatasi TaxID=29031 RepID=A0A1B0CYI3_PHLPP